MLLISETHFTRQPFIKFKVYHLIHPENVRIFKENICHYEEYQFDAEDIQAMSEVKIILASVYSCLKQNIKYGRFKELKDCKES